MLEQVKAPRRDLLQADRLREVVGLSPEGQQAAGEVRRPLDGLRDHLDVLLQLRVVGPRDLDLAGLEHHRGEEIVELVRDAADQLADRPELSRPDDLGLLPRALRDVLDEDADSRIRDATGGGQGDRDHLEQALAAPEQGLAGAGNPCVRGPARRLDKVKPDILRKRKGTERRWGSREVDSVELAGVPVHRENPRPRGLRLYHRHGHRDVVVERLQQRPLLGELQGLQGIRLPEASLAQITEHGDHERERQSNGGVKLQVRCAHDVGAVLSEVPAVDAVELAGVVDDRQTLVEPRQQLRVARVHRVRLADLIAVVRLAEHPDVGEPEPAAQGHLGELRGETSL